MVLVYAVFFPNIYVPRWCSGKESVCQCRRCRFYPWLRKIPQRRAWRPIPVFFPGESHGQRSLAAIVHGVAKSRTWLSTHTCVCVDTLLFRVYLLPPLPGMAFPIVAAQLASLLHPSVCSNATSSERTSLTTPNKTEVPLSLCIPLCYLFFKILITTLYTVYVSHLLKCKLHESRGFVLFTAIHRLHWALKEAHTYLFTHSTEN